MVKKKSAWFCKECGYESAKWLGKCPACGQWNTFVEEVVESGAGAAKSQMTGGQKSKPVKLKEISYEEEPRITLGSQELDRLLGGGLVEGSIVLLGGEPGIGKSTLSLQLPLYCRNIRTLYVSGEESARQIKMRAQRLMPQGVTEEDCSNLTIYCETLLENILQKAQDEAPQLLIVDSIQTIYSEGLESSPGTVSQVRECAALLLKFAKQSNTPVLLIGHITKDGSIAGPKVLEHIVDVVLQFEGDNTNSYRILRAIKNRFGSTAELAIFQMTQTGLKEVLNPSDILMPMHDEEISGIAVGAILDGTRPLLIETQALVSGTAYSVAQRSTTGCDMRRVNMILAVLEKRIGFKLSSKDVFLNMAGGLRVADPALDMAIATAIISSYLDLAIPTTWCFASEIGLSGECRPAVQTPKRILEAERLGFKRIFISEYGAKELPKTKSIEVVTVKNISNLVPLLNNGNH